MEEEGEKWKLEHLFHLPGSSVVFLRRPLVEDIPSTPLSATAHHRYSSQSSVDSNTSSSSSATPGTAPTPTEDGSAFAFPVNGGRKTKLSLVEAKRRKLAKVEEEPEQPAFVVPAAPPKRLPKDESGLD